MTEGIIQKVIGQEIQSIRTALKDEPDRYRNRFIYIDRLELCQRIQQELIEEIKKEYEKDFWLRSNVEILTKLIGDSQ